MTLKYLVIVKVIVRVKFDIHPHITDYNGMDLVFVLKNNSVSYSPDGDVSKNFITWNMHLALYENSDHRSLLILVIVAHNSWNGSKICRDQPFLKKFGCIGERWTRFVFQLIARLVGKFFDIVRFSMIYTNFMILNEEQFFIHTRWRIKIAWRHH